MSSIIRWLLSGTIQEDGDYHSSDFEPRKKQRTPASTVENATPRALYFHELEELRLCIRERSIWNPIDAYEGVFLLPKLKTLSLTNFEWLVRNSEKMRWGSMPSLLTRLELHNCCIEPLSLTHILTRCKNLKHLTISIEGLSELISEYEWNVYGFGDVLRELGRGLETLLFSTKAVEEIQGYSTWPTILGCVGSLKELGSLRHLGIERRYNGRPSGSEFENGSEIVLSDALPRSLKTLHLITEEGTWRELRDEIAYHAFHKCENEQVCKLILAESCPELCRVDITRITGLADIEGNRFEITSELGGRWHMERTPDEKTWSGTRARLHTAVWKC
ncbi:hypothetical protein DER45DRAFT_567114 [Fusarium avenaceum]|nr:hypothetical protein DER45DRAFT_567114 [Fusarium avenaceum]